MASYWLDSGTGMGPPIGSLIDDTAYADYRCFVWGTGASLLQRAAPTAGGVIDGVSKGHGFDPVSNSHRGGGFLAVPHVPVQVEASAAFGVGAQLETLADGRVKAVAAGTPVLTSLEAAAGAGSLVWAVFL